MSEKKKKPEKRKVSQKKMTKFHQMWIEQILFKIDDIHARLDKVESDIKETRETVRLINEKIENILQGDFNGRKKD